MPRRPHLNARGQASLEYLGVILLVVAGLATTGSFVAGPALANAVGRQLRHALCTASGQRCLVIDPQPCVVKSRTVRGTVSAKIALIKAGRGMALLRFERSDGTIDLTLLDEVSLGVQAELGAGSRVDLGQHELGAGLAGEAQVVATLGGGRTWRVRGATAARALQHRLEQVAAGTAADHIPAAGHLLKIGQHLLGVGSGTALPPPRSHTLRGQLDAQLTGTVGSLVKAKLGASVLLGVEAIADGSHVVTLMLDGRLTAGLVAGTRTLQPQDSAILSVATDPTGRPTTATLTLVGTASAGQALAPGGTRGGRLQGRRIRIDERLDLTQADNATALTGLLASPVHDDMGAAAARIARLFDSGEKTVSHYRTRDSAYGAGGDVGLGVSVGMSADLSDDQAQLTSAATRPPGGAWEQRTDCIA